MSIPNIRKLIGQNTLNKGQKGRFNLLTSNFTGLYSNENTTVKVSLSRGTS